MIHTPRRPLLVAPIGLPCPYCGEPMTVPDRAPSHDHIRPKSPRHTLDKLGNRAVVCWRCNQDKGSLSVGRFLNRLARAGDPRAMHVEAFMRQRGKPLDFLQAGRAES
jgi:5-methylcytosine-specific restriction endonuclease McrA